MGWFNRLKKGINTETKDKKNTKEGLWYKCPECKKIVPMEDHLASLNVCECGHHDRISSLAYFELLLDNDEYKELDANLSSKNPLKFVDKKKYSDRLKAVEKKTGLKDAITTVHGKID
ncbi:MAG: acetyl-CoA carboxylase carboxyl transferase subunit beta, partial [Bacteroidetes bacterium]